ncbi:hypothetical protein ACFFRR_003374 [Megaselia abdita]
MFSKRFQVFLCYSYVMYGVVFSYTQIAGGGGTNNSSDTGPKIYKATHMDLIFPEVFNRTRENAADSEIMQPKSTSVPILPTIPTTPPSSFSSLASIVMPTFNPPQHNEQISAESTGRAVDYQPYPFQQLISAGKPRPPVKPNIPIRRPVSPVYPSYMSSNGNNRNGPPKIQDRFTPGEATAAHSFNRMKNNNAPYNPRPSASNTNENYVPPKNIYSFPPNSDVNYPSPSEIKPEVVKANSYEYPASGPIDNEFKGPINPSYLPSGRDPIPPPDPVPVPQDPAPSSNDNPDPPASEDSPSDDGDSHAGEINVTGDDPGPPVDAHDHHHDHHHDYIPGKLYPTPPPGYIPDGNDHDHDHHHHHEHIPEITDDHHHDHFEDHGVKAFDYHDLVYDDHFFHHHHHHPTEPPPPPPPPSTEAPEPPPEPRVKKYSYFYIGRKLWYIPLYFTVWFSFYVLWLILKSIARHKVNLPNHYVAKRSLPDMSHKQATEHIDKLTVFVMDNIEKFKDKYFV